MALKVSISSAVSNVDPNADCALVNVVTVAFYCSVPVIVLVTVSDEVHCVNGKRTATLSAVKGDEPSLTAGVTPSHVEVALKNNAESGVILLLGEDAILDKTNVTAVSTLPRTLFPVSVVSVRALWSDVPF